jgi:hypothetical protein
LDSSPYAFIFSLTVAMSAALRLPCSLPPPAAAVPWRGE